MDIKFNRCLEFSLPKPYSSFLWGARKTGKSTYLKRHFPNSLYVDFLKADVFQRYFIQPHLLREEILANAAQYLAHPIIIDEVQKVPAILDEVHWMIENIPHIQFILCGSSVRKLKQSGSNLLGGRAWRHMFLPLCYPELKGAWDWSRIMNHGLLPSHYLSEYPSKLLSSYVIDYIIPEVQTEANIRNQQGFTRFLDALGFCLGEMLNFNNIGRDCGIDSKTVKSYFDILVDMYLGYYVYPYKKQANRRIIQQTPKFYLMDTGVSNHLKRYRFTEWRGPDAGKAFEQYVFLELMAYKLYKDHPTKIEYWRTSTGDEVDFVLDDGKIAIETKISAPIQQKDLRGLLIFGQEYGGSLHVVSLEPRKRLMQVADQQITIWPVQEFLEHLWAGKIV